MNAKDEIEAIWKVLWSPWKVGDDGPGGLVLYKRSEMRKAIISLKKLREMQCQELEQATASDKQPEGHKRQSID